MINLNKSDDYRESHIDDIIGIYLTYRIRLSENQEAPVAQEVMRIFRSQKGLAFEHWYLQYGAQPDCFQGVVLNAGKILWLIGAAQHGEDRLRVMSFRNTAGMNAQYSELKWGILCSDIPRPSSYDPAAGRILMRKVKGVTDNIQQFIRDNVKHLRSDDDIIDDNDIVKRLIDNEFTANSNPRSITPAQLPNGEQLKDMVLKVDQSTLEQAIFMLHGRMNGDNA